MPLYPRTCADAPFDSTFIRGVAAGKFNLPRGTEKAASALTGRNSLLRTRRNEANMLIYMENLRISTKFPCNTLQIPAFRRC